MAENTASDSTSSWEDKCECRAQERTSNLQTVAGTCGVSQKAADAKPKTLTVSCSVAALFTVFPGVYVHDLSLV